MSRVRSRPVLDPFLKKYMLAEQLAIIIKIFFVFDPISSSYLSDQPLAEKEVGTMRLLKTN